MYVKTCPKCGNKSYSASDSDIWLCPYPVARSISLKDNGQSLTLLTRCQKDLTHLPAQIAQ